MLLVLRSVTDELLKQRSQSLSGRIHYIELTVLNSFEIEKPSGKPLQKLWMRGGFANSYTFEDGETSYL